MRLLKLLAKARLSSSFKLSTTQRKWTSPARNAASAVPRAASLTTDTKESSSSSSYRAFIDFKFVQSNLELVKENATRRLVDASPDEVVRLYDEYVRLTQEADAVRAARNDNSAQMKRKLEAEERERLIEHGKNLKAELEAIDERLTLVESELQTEGKKLPNLTHPDVPVGGEEAATLLREVGSKPEFAGFEAKDHVRLGEELGILDFDTGSVVSGSKFYYLRKEAALLEMALVNYAMQKICAKGFDPIITPDLVRGSVLEKCGFQPRGEGTQVYSVENSDLCLTGTAEIPLGASGQRPARPARRARGCTACISSARWRCSWSARPSRASSCTRTSWISRWICLRSWVCISKCSICPAATSARRRIASLISKRGCRASSGTERSAARPTARTTRAGGSTSDIGPARVRVRVRPRAGRRRRRCQRSLCTPSTVPGAPSRG